MARLVVYRDVGGGWRWRLVAINGRTVADSGEGYTTRFGAVRAAQALRRHAGGARVDVELG